MIYLASIYIRDQMLQTKSQVIRVTKDTLLNINKLDIFKHVRQFDIDLERDFTSIKSLCQLMFHFHLCVKENCTILLK